MLDTPNASSQPSKHQKDGEAQEIVCDLPKIAVQLVEKIAEILHTQRLLRVEQAMEAPQTQVQEVEVQEVVRGVPKIGAQQVQEIGEICRSNE